MAANETFGNSTPLGLIAFATTSFVLGFYSAHLIDASTVGIVIPFTFALGGLIHIIVSILEFIRGAGFTGVVFGTYGSFFWLYGIFVQFYQKTIPAAHTGAAVELFLLMYAVLTTIFLVAALRTNKVIVVILTLVDAALIVLALGAGENWVRVTEAGGWIVMAFSVLAWYLVAEAMTTMTWGRQLLPVGPIGPLPARPSHG